MIINKKISIDEAITLAKKKKLKPNMTVDFANQKINALDAISLARYGFEIPEENVVYDDNNIDYSDIPEITEEDVESGKINWAINANIVLDKEVKEWIARENININEFASTLIQNFYKSIKNLPKNAAI
jgi:hypothetical protein